MPKDYCFRTIARGLLCAFFLNTTTLPGSVAVAQDFVLPPPGRMVALSPSFSPPVLKGIQLDPKNPFKFHFFVDKGEGALSQQDLKEESSKLIKYFLASLTIPEKDLWVNLSPYEKNRIVPQEFGQTEMGRDLLAEDYILKQITASLIYPEDKIGKEFWQKVYAQAQAKYGTTNIPINTFNKVWIVPDKAVVYENNGTAFVLENHLKVMLEEDYLSMQKHGVASSVRRDSASIGANIIRQLVLPQLEKEVNEGKNFAQLRQVFYSLILATWYKKKIKESIINKIYSNRNKIGGVSVSAADKDRIYQEYLKAFKKGVFNYIQEDALADGKIAPRKYFSGGVEAKYLIDVNMSMVGPKTVNPAQLATLNPDQIINESVNVEFNQAMKSAISPETIYPLDAPGVNLDPQIGYQIGSVFLLPSLLMDSIWAYDQANGNMQEFYRQLESKKPTHIGGMAIHHVMDNFGPLRLVAMELYRKYGEIYQSPADQNFIQLININPALLLKQFPQLSRIRDRVYIPLESKYDMKDLLPSSFVHNNIRSSFRVTLGHEIFESTLQNYVNRHDLATAFQWMEKILKERKSSGNELQVAVQEWEAEFLKEILNIYRELPDYEIPNEFFARLFYGYLILDFSYEHGDGAYLFDTHSGLRREFAKLAESEASSDPDARTTAEVLKKVKILYKQVNALTEQFAKKVEAQGLNERLGWRVIEHADPASEMQLIKAAKYVAKGISKRTGWGFYFQSSDAAMGAQAPEVRSVLRGRIDPLMMDRLADNLRPDVVQRISKGQWLLIGPGTDAGEIESLFKKFPDINSLDVIGFLPDAVIEKIEKELQERNPAIVNRVHFTNGNIESTHFDHQFDAVYSSSVFDLTLWDKRKLREMVAGLKRAIKRDGVYLTGLSDLEYFTDAGFEVKLQIFKNGLSIPSSEYAFIAALDPSLWKQPLSVEEKIAANKAMNAPIEEVHALSPDDIEKILANPSANPSYVVAVKTRYRPNINTYFADPVSPLMKGTPLFYRLTPQQKPVAISFDRAKSIVAALGRNKIEGMTLTLIKHVNRQQKAGPVGWAAVITARNSAIKGDVSMNSPSQSANSSMIVLSSEELAEIKELANRLAPFQTRGMGHFIHRIKISLVNLPSNSPTLNERVLRDLELDMRNMDLLISEADSLDTSVQRRREAFLENLHKLIEGDISFDSPIRDLLEFDYWLSRPDGEEKLKEWDRIKEAYAAIKPRLLKLIRAHLPAEPIEETLDMLKNQLVFKVDQLGGWYRLRYAQDAVNLYGKGFGHPLRDLSTEVAHFTVRYHVGGPRALTSDSYLSVEKEFNKTLAFIDPWRNLSEGEVLEKTKEVQHYLDSNAINQKEGKLREAYSALSAGTDPLDREEKYAKLYAESKLLEKNLLILKLVSREDWFDVRFSARLEKLYQDILRLHRQWHERITLLLRQKGLSPQLIEKEDQRPGVEGAHEDLIDGRRVWLDAQNFLIQSDGRRLPAFKEFKDFVDNHRTQNPQFELMTLEEFVDTVQKWAIGPGKKEFTYHPEWSRDSAVQKIIEDHNFYKARSQFLRDVQAEILWRAGIRPDSSMKTPISAAMKASAPENESEFDKRVREYRAQLAEYGTADQIQAFDKGSQQLKGRLESNGLTDLSRMKITTQLTDLFLSMIGDSQTLINVFIDSGNTFDPERNKKILKEYVLEHQDIHSIVGRHGITSTRAYQIIHAYKKWKLSKAQFLLRRQGYERRDVAPAARIAEWVDKQGLKLPFTVEQVSKGTATFPQEVEKVLNSIPENQVRKLINGQWYKKTLFVDIPDDGVANKAMSSQRSPRLSVTVKPVLDAQGRPGQLVTIKGQGQHQEYRIFNEEELEKMLGVFGIRRNQHHPDYFLLPGGTAYARAEQVVDLNNAESIQRAIKFALIQRDRAQSAGPDRAQGALRRLSAAPRLIADPNNSLLALGKEGRRQFLLGTYPIFENGGYRRTGYIYAHEEIYNHIYFMSLSYSSGQPPDTSYIKLVENDDRTWEIINFYPYRSKDSFFTFRSTRCARIILDYIAKAVRASRRGLESHGVTSQLALVSYLKNGWPSQIKKNIRDHWTAIDYPSLFDERNLGELTVIKNNSKYKYRLKLTYNPFTRKYAVSGGDLAPMATAVVVNPKNFVVMDEAGKPLGQIISFYNFVWLRMPPDAAMTVEQADAAMLIKRRTFLRGLIAGLAQVSAGSNTAFIEAGKLLAGMGPSKTTLEISPDAISLFNITALSYVDPNHFSQHMYSAVANHAFIRATPFQKDDEDYLNTLLNETVPKLKESTSAINTIVQRLKRPDSKEAVLRELRIALRKDAESKQWTRSKLSESLSKRFEGLYAQFLDLPDDKLEELLLRHVQFLANDWEESVKDEIAYIRRTLNSIEEVKAAKQQEITQTQEDMKTSWPQFSDVLSADAFDQSALERWKDEGGKVLPADAAMKALASDLNERNEAMATEAIKPGDSYERSLLSGGAELLGDHTALKAVQDSGDQEIRVRRSLNGGIELIPSRDWAYDNSSLDQVDNSLHIRDFIIKQHAKKPASPVVIVDWGCGNGEALIELLSWAKDRKIPVKLYGFADQYYPNWKKAPAGITFILEDGKRIADYFNQDIVDLMFSHSGLIHYVLGSSLMKSQRYVEELLSLLSSEGQLRTIGLKEHVPPDFEAQYSRYSLTEGTVWSRSLNAAMKAEQPTEIGDWRQKTAEGIVYKFGWRKELTAEEAAYQERIKLENPRDPANAILSSSYDFIGEIDDPDAIKGKGSRLVQCRIFMGAPESKELPFAASYQLVFKDGKLLAWSRVAHVNAEKQLPWLEKFLGDKFDALKGVAFAEKPMKPQAKLNAVIQSMRNNLEILKEPDFEGMKEEISRGRISLGDALNHLNQAHVFLTSSQWIEAHQELALALKSIQEFQWVLTNHFTDTNIHDQRLIENLRGIGASNIKIIHDLKSVIVSVLGKISPQQAKAIKSLEKLAQMPRNMHTGYALYKFRDAQLNVSSEGKVFWDWGENGAFSLEPLMIDPSAETISSRLLTKVYRIDDLISNHVSSQKLLKEYLNIRADVDRISVEISLHGGYISDDLEKQALWDLNPWKDVYKQKQAVQMVDYYSFKIALEEILSQFHQFKAGYGDLQSPETKKIDTFLKVFLEQTDARIDLIRQGKEIVPFSEKESDDLKQLMITFVREAKGVRQFDDSTLNFMSMPDSEGNLPLTQRQKDALKFERAAKQTILAFPADRLADAAMNGNAKEHWEKELKLERIRQLRHFYEQKRGSRRSRGDLSRAALINVSKQNKAMKTGPGGIDLNPAQMAMQVKKEGQDFKFQWNGQTFDTAQITGATFSIESMTSVTNLTQILGL